MFDPEEFQNSAITDANSTEMIPVDEGEYLAVLRDPKIVPWKSRDGEKEGLKLELKAEIDDAAVKAKVGRDTVTVRADIMLDLTPTGGLDMGKGRNVTLGRLREAAGLNVPGRPFQFSMLEGVPVKVRVTQRTYEDRIFNDVKGFAPAA